MKRLAIVLLCLVCCLLVFVACKTKEETPVDLVEVPPSVPADTCEHEWDLTAFVTEETTVPFAGEFTCKKCQKQEVRSFSYTDIDIPLINVVGDVSSFRTESGRIDQDVKVSVGLTYQSADLSLDCAATLKIQGKSTATDDKNNFSVNLLDESGDKKKVAFKDSWGAGYKYVLKSNYADPSSVRNIALSSLYGQVAHGVNLADHYTYLVNCGAVDGYPVLVYLNGRYHGLYNWVIRKDKWLYGMGNESAGEAVLEGSDMDPLTSDEGVVMLPEGMTSAKSWEEEYVNENFGEEGWAEKSFNEMLFAIRNASAAEIRAAIADYTELQRTLDVMLFNCVFGTADNVCGNQVWCTFDGKKWAPVVYDLDRALGRSGNCLIEPDEDVWELISQNVLYDKIIHAYFEEIKARYLALRNGVFTVENVMSVIREKLCGVDDKYFLAELEKWPDASWRDYDGSELITGFDVELRLMEDYLTARFAYCDSFFGRQTA